MKTKAQKYYEENKEKLKKRTMERLKETNYATEKTEKARQRRGIKRKTRYLYPLKGKICQVTNCNEPATERHHTHPIEVHNFIFLCHKHHVQVHRELKSGGLKLQFTEKGVRHGRSD